MEVLSPTGWLTRRAVRDNPHYSYKDFKRVGSTVTNGAAIGSSNGNISLMNVGSGSSSFIGSVDDIRVTKGVARYTGPFTVPARPFFDH